MRLQANARTLEGYHSPQLDVDVRLNTNESPLPPPDGWFAAVEKYIRTSEPHRYPDRNVSELRERIAALHGVAAGNVWCANGSNEIIQTLVLAYGGHDKTATVFQPTYAMHSHIPRITGTGLRIESREGDFSVSESQIREAGPHSDLMFLCSPNNPTGTVETRSNIRAAMQTARGITVVDEAYGQFAELSAVELLDEEVPMVVTRTFSKTWAMAGLRLGYVVAPTWVVNDLQAVALPYHLSSLTQAAGIVALDYHDEMNERISYLVLERERISARLRELPVEVWPSGANFILFRPNSGDNVWSQLVAASVLVRDTSSWDGLAGCFRVTVGTREENDRFLEALEQALQ